MKELARDLRYRPLPNLIGLVVAVESPGAMVADIQRRVARDVPGLGACDSAAAGSLLVAIAKYGIVDLTFNVTGVEWTRNDAPGIPLLRDYGFFPDAGESAGLFDSDPACLVQLGEEIGQQRTFLRLLLREQPLRDMQQHMMRLADNGGITSQWIDDFLSAYFPKSFVVRDACVTNAPLIWLHRYFYL